MTSFSTFPVGRIPASRIRDLAIRALALARGALARAGAQAQPAAAPAQPPAAPTLDETLVETEDFGSLPREALWAKDKSVMVLIPAGAFIQGLENPGEKGGKIQEAPAHEVWLSSFYIDKYEVTNAQYMKFVEITGHIKPRITRGRGLLDPEKPVVGVTWHDATAYAAWVDKELPTESQWEKAARGTDSRLYPWGEDWKEGAANTKEAGFGTTRAPGSFADDVSPYGVFDLAGNVAEWVFDWYDRDFYKKSPRENPRGPEEGVFSRTIRGGDYYNASSEARLTNRRFRVHNQALEELGFRCVRNLKIPPTPTPRPTMEFFNVTPTATPEPFSRIEPELFAAWAKEESLPLTLTPLNVGRKSPVKVINRMPVEVSLTLANAEPRIILYNEKLNPLSAKDIHLAVDTSLVLYVKIAPTGAILRCEPEFQSNALPAIILEPSRLLTILPKPGEAAEAPQERPQLIFAYQPPAFPWNRVTFFNAAETTVTLKFDKYPLEAAPAEGVDRTAAWFVDLGPAVAWDAVFVPGKRKVEFFYAGSFNCGAKPLEFVVSDARDLRGVLVRPNTRTNEKVQVFNRNLPVLESLLYEATLGTTTRRR